MAETKNGRGGKTASRDPAHEAWDALAALVYPPPFIPIARKLGLSPSTFGALRALDQPRTMGEMATLLHCDNSNVTGIVDGLEARGLAARTPSEDDRRVKLVTITAEGRRIRSRLIKAVEKPPEWLTGLAAADQRTLRDLLKRAGAGAG
jgi:DNA-binding MarR family transcriptional regulator